MNIDKLVESVENIPYHKFIGLKFSRLSEGYGELRVPIRKELLNFNGMLHGGIYYTICDLAASIALVTTLNDGYYPATNDINVSILAASNQGTLTVKSNVLKLGKRLAFVESKAFNENDELLAVGRVTKTILARK
jgi:uncharacterized protein (TIGR00369 family)